MSIKMSKSKTILFTLAIWLSTFTIMFSMPIFVIVNELYEAFPDNAGIVTALLSWPGLITAVAGLLAGTLLKKLSTKTELIIAAALMCLGIVMARGGVVWLFVCSLLIAVGAGISNTAGMAMISEVFLDEGKRAKQMGYYNAVMAGTGAVVSFLAGILAVNGWQSAFLVNWFAIPMLLLTVFCLPNIKPADRVQDAAPEGDAAGAAAPAARGGFGARFWIYFASTFLFFGTYVPVSSFLSVYVAENALGDTALVGTATSLGTVGSLCMCLAFGFIFPKLGRKYSLIGITVSILFYAWAWLAPSRIAIILASTAIGASYGSIFSMVYAYSAELVPPEKIGQAMGVMTFNCCGAIFLFVYLFSYLMGVLGTATATFPIAIGMLAVALVIELVCGFKADKSAAAAE